MNVRITTFTNPFSFFCVAEDVQYHNNKNYINPQNNEKFNLSPSNSKTITTLNHGQYVAVMWNNKWARGVVSLETQLLIWLIDYGINLRPNDKTICIDLPIEYRKLPTKIFEAGIHGVVPVDKVIGDLFLEIRGKGIVNIIDELDTWPVFLEKNTELYVSNLSKCYVTRRRHRSSTLKPDLPFQLPNLTLQTGLETYMDIVENLIKSEDKCDDESILDDSSTVVDFTKTKVDNSKYKLTPKEIEKYANRYIIVNGQEQNVLTILINKARDLNICEKYKDYDLKSVGRGISHRTLKMNNAI